MIAMQFELTEALVDEILFSMEDQDGEFLVDTLEGILVNVEDEEFDETEADETERYLSLPEWGPTDGYRLMERFTTALRNPLMREELSAALDRGRGVFRAFKDTVARHPEIERFWFKFKDNEMKREIIRWYNALRESWGMEQIGGEPEDIDGLMLEDFRFRAGTEADREAALNLHRRAAAACRKGEIPGGAITSAGRELAAEMFTVMNDWVFPGDRCLVAETAGGDFAGYISAVRPEPRRLHIGALEVNPEYQGLGLGESLLTRLLETADGGYCSIDLPSGMEHFARVLLRESFELCVQRYCRSV
jgi:ribosomal protein S18 acetylase RimI-like enzyme